MAEKTAEGANLSLKLMVHKKEQRVIFAEADNDFVDTLFSIMTLPLGTIVRVLEKCQDEKVEALGSLKNVYNSLMDLSENYFSASESKHMLLNPTSSSYDLCRNLKLNIDDSPLPKYFVCHDLWCTDFRVPYFANYDFAKCPNCGKLMDFKIEGYTFSNRTRFGGFVTNLTTFIVTDDLQAIPNTSPDIGVQLLCDSGITDTSQLEEMTFIIGRDQILILLKWALLFRYPLTYMVFQKLYIGEVIVKASLETVVQQSTSNDNEAGSCSKAMKLKVTLRKSNSKFLFAVVEGAFVDFLLGLLEIPLGTVIGKLLNGNSSLESLENLFASISTMNVAYIKSQDLMNVLLQPQLAWNHVSQNFFSLDASKGSATISRTPIGSKKKADLKYKNPKDCGGLVKALPKFLLTDEFVLTPLSCISTISMLKKLKVPLNDIVEHEVSIGIEEGLKILKASLKSSSILTEALLKGKAWKFDNSSEPE